MRAVGQESGHVECGVDDLLEVVEHEQQLAVRNVVDQGLVRRAVGGFGKSEGPRHGREHQRPPADGGQLDKAHAQLELIGDVDGNPDRQARLARTARPGQRQEANVGLQEAVADVGEQGIATDEGAWLGRRGESWRSALAAVGDPAA